MIKTLLVEGLNNRTKPLNLQFHPDVNLLTGKNGSSKTTILKLIWYMNSGKIYNLIKEVNFTFAELTTSNNTISIRRDLENASITISTQGGKSFTLSDVNLRELELRRSPRIHEKFYEIHELSIPTIFFPTFRRIEGGFSMDENFDPRFGRVDEIRSAMEEFSRRLSIRDQRFITSISTDDIVSLLNKEYSNINSQINQIQKQKSDDIIKKIKAQNQNDKETLEEFAQALHYFVEFDNDNFSAQRN
jgi:ABC-type cobalamin/Fe3+-siderophores transport system ATPase subunit